MIMNPFNLTGDALQLEAQSLRDRPAGGVFGRTFNGDPVQFPDIETMVDHGAATCGHNAFALMPGIQPIAKGCPTVDPINVQVVDHAAKLGVMPDARKKSAVVGVLLLPVGDRPFRRGRRLNQIHPWVPLPDVIPVGRDQLEQCFRMLTVNQA